MKLEVNIGTVGEYQIRTFLLDSGRSHHDSDALFPGYTFELGFWPPAEEWSLFVSCGSAKIEIQDFSVVGFDY